MSKILTCPQCGALVGKHITHCYQCNKFLMGSRFESMFMRLIPAKYMANPATSLLVFLSAVPFAIVTVIAGAGALLLVPIYNMVQIGATEQSLFLMDEPWRVVTANFVHFNALHLGMNTLGLIALGPLVERFFDYRKAFVIFVISGTLTFTAYIGGQLYWNFLSGGVAGGASAGLFGLMGAGVAGAMKHDWQAAQIKKDLIRNLMQNIVLGLIILPLGSTILHIYGFIFGFLLAYITPPQEGSLGFQRRVFSYLFLACLLLIGASTFFQARELLKYPLKASAEQDTDALMAQCTDTGPEENDTEAITRERILQAAKTCETLTRELKLNPPYGVWRILHFYADYLPEVYDKKVLARQLERLDRFDHNRPGQN